MLLNYLQSEVFLVLKRWKLLIINLLYFAIPVLFFQIIAMPIIDKNNEYFFEIISNGLFLVVFITVLQFFIFSKVNNEYITGITVYKFCLPLRNSLVILCDLIAENIFGVILLLFCLSFHCLTVKTESLKSLLICGLILVPACVCITHSYTLLFFSSTENMVIASVFSFSSLLPLLFFISNIVQNINYMQNIVIAVLYSFFITLIYIMQVSLNINNISL